MIIFTCYLLLQIWTNCFDIQLAVLLLLMSQCSYASITVCSVPHSLTSNMFPYSLPVSFPIRHIGHFPVFHRITTWIFSRVLHWLWSWYFPTLVPNSMEIYIFVHFGPSLITFLSGLVVSASIIWYLALPFWSILALSAYKRSVFRHYTRFGYYLAIKHLSMMSSPTKYRTVECGSWSLTPCHWGNSPAFLYLYEIYFVVRNNIQCSIAEKHDTLTKVWLCENKRSRLSSVASIVELYTSCDPSVLAPLFTAASFQYGVEKL